MFFYCSILSAVCVLLGGAVENEKRNETQPVVNGPVPHQRNDPPKEPPTFIGCDRVRRTVCPANIMDQVRRCLPAGLLPLVPGPAPGWSPFQNIGNIEQCTGNPVIGELIQKNIIDKMKPNITLPVASVPKTPRGPRSAEYDDYSDYCDKPKRNMSKKMRQRGRRHPGRNMPRVIRIPSQRARPPSRDYDYDYDYPRRTPCMLELKSLLSSLVKELVQAEIRKRSFHREPDYYDYDYPVAPPPTQQPSFDQKREQLKNDLKNLFKEIAAEVEKRASLANSTATPQNGNIITPVPSQEDVTQNEIKCSSEFVADRKAPE